ncbi:hypothetical protein KC19_2G088600 [Ceratodon purpureus]|nr:hypothetical protein KC19_2G088600 [Ceratodon purpureus]
MDTKSERALKGPQDGAQFLNGHEPPRPPPPARRLAIISWTTFSVGVNFALLAMMFVQPSSPSDWFSKARLLPQEHLKKTNGSAPCYNSANRVLCLPRPPSPRLSFSASEHLLLCSGNGHYVIEDEETGACHCHACFSGGHCEQLDPDCHLNLFHGDPTLFEEYWLTQPDAPTVIPSWQGMSYFAHRNNDYLFVDYFLEQAIRKIHGMVGNAVTEGRYIVLGVGSTQLYQAALYALASPESPSPTPVVSAIPHYSSFEGCTKFMDSRKYKWVGDAEKFKRSATKDQPYIELVTSPNNPCGSMNKPVVNGNGSVVNDLAYYWPHYTAITAPADYPIMLWTMSKISGHAGTRLGWAIVEDASVAAKMAYFIQLNTLGLSQDAQARGITLLRAIMSSYENQRAGGVERERQPFFHYGQAVLEGRWRRMRQALDNTSRFDLPEYESSFCSFLGKNFRANPAFLWLKCKAEEDCQQLLKENKIIARGGAVFGMSTQYVRVSMLDRHPLFDLLLARLASLK